MIRQKNTHKKPQSLILPWPLFVLVQCRPRPWKNNPGRRTMGMIWSSFSLRSQQQPLVVLGWPPLVLQRWISARWQTPEPSGSLVEWPLSEGGTLLPSRQGHTGLSSLSFQTDKGLQHSCPLAISARQRPITTRQRPNSKLTWMKPDGSEWSCAAKVSVIISNKFKL